LKLPGRKVLVLVEELYQDLEVWYPILRLREEGAQVVVVGSGSARTYKGKYGYPIDVDVHAQDVDVAGFDAVIVPGGYAPDLMRRTREMIQIVRDAYLQGKVVAAICHGGWVLASAGILKDKRVTGFFAIKDDLVHAGARYVDEEVVRDGQLITSRKPEDLPSFCREIVKALIKLGTVGESGEPRRS
jgi:protease I